MKVTVLGDGAVRYERAPGPLTIEAPTAETEFTPFDMLASAVAVCTYTTVRSWASNAKLDADDLTVDVRLTYAEHPHRAGSVDIVLRWPSLPAEREGAARRAAELCPVHQTLRAAPTMTTAISREATT